MKLSKSPNPNTPARIGALVARFAFCAGLVAAGHTAVAATTRTWVGATDNYLITSGNWSPSGAPQAGSGDTMLWNGSQAGNLVLTNNQSGSFNNLDNNPGLFVNVAATQTGSLTLYELVGGTGRIRINSYLTVASGAGAVTFGGNGTALPLVPGVANAATHYFTNNAANPVTFSSDVYFLMGGGGTHAVNFYGSGNWVMNCSFQAQNSGSAFAPIVNGPGSLTLVGTPAPGIGYSGTYGNVTLNAGTLIVGGANGLGSGNNFIITGGNLDSSVANLVNAGNNPQNWNGNFAFLGTQSLDLGSGTVTMNASRIVTVNGKTLQVDGAVTGNGFSLTKAGAGTLYLTGANAYTGGTVVSNGVLKIGSDNVFTNAGNVVVNGTLDLNGYNPTVINLGGTGLVDSVSGGAPTLTVSNTSSSTFSGSIANSAGTVSLAKAGSGTLTLAGANTYAGGTAVNAGTLLVNGSVSSAVTVASGATLGGTGTIHGNVDWSQAASAGYVTLTPSGTATGSNSTPLTVTGNLALSGNSLTVFLPGGTIAPGTYTLMTYGSVSGSTPAFATAPVFSPAQFGLVSTISTSGGKVLLTVTVSGLDATWTTDADGNWTAAANWSSNPAYPHSAGDAAHFGVSTSFRTVTLDANVSLGAAFFTNNNSFLVADAGKTLTFDNGANGVASIVVSGGSSNVIAAALTLNTNLTISTVSGTGLALTNAISGARTLSVSGAGTVTLSTANTYGPSAGSVGTSLSGGVLQLGNGSALGAGDLSVSSSSSIRAAAAMTLANNLIAGAGTTSMDNNGNNVTLSGVVSGSGGLAKNGLGTLTLNNANTFGNGMAINAGTVQLGNASAIPGGTGYGNVSLGTNATLDLSGYSVTFNGLNSSAASSVVDSSTAGALTLTLGENGANGTFLGTLRNSSGTLGLVKDGAGTQTLGGTNSLSGTTTINAGILQVGNGQTNSSTSGMAVGLGSGPVVDNGALQFSLAGTNIFANDISGSGGVNLNNTGIYNLTGNNTFTGGITNNGAWLWINGASQLGTGPKTIQSTQRPGQIHLDGSLGNLAIGSSYSFVLSGDNGALINDSGNNTISGDIAIVLGAGHPYIVCSNGVLTLAGQISTAAGNLARTLTLGGPGNGEVSGTITEASGVPASLTKADAGTWTLSGAANNYSGVTTVSNGVLVLSGNNSGNGNINVYGGTLLVNGNNFGTGLVTNAANATLGGTGSIYSAVTWQAGSFGTFTASASGSTPLTVYGNVVLNTNQITVNVVGGTPLPAGTYVLLSEGNILSSISGAFASTATITGAGIAAGTRAVVTTTASQVVLTVVNNSVWVHNANGNWTTGANWDSNPNYPSLAGQTATLGVGSAFTTINLDASETVGGIFFTNSNSFDITSAVNGLSLDNNGNGAVLNVTGGAANAIGAAVSLNDGSGTTVSLASGTALAISGNVAGSSALSIAGSGVLTLSGSNTYSGFTTINGSTLILGSTNAVGSGTLTIAAGASLDSSVPDLVNDNNNSQNWNGSFTFLGSQNLNLGMGSVTMPSDLTLSLTNTRQLTVGGAISGGGRLYLTNLNASGLPTLELDGANSMAGLSFSGPAILSIGSDSALGTGTLDILVAGCVIQSSSSATRTIANVVGMAGAVLNTAGTGDLIFNGGVPSYNGTKTYNITNPVTTIAWNLPNGAGGIIKNGPGTLVLSGSNTNTGGTVVNNGTLALGGATALSTGTLTMNGGALDSTVVNLTNANNNAQVWTTKFAYAGSQNLNLGAGSVTMSANTTITVSNNTLEVDGAVGGAGALTKAGSGSLILGGANTYSNSTTVTAGTLEMAQAGLGTNSTVSIAGGALLKLDFSTTNQVAGLILGGVSQAAGVYKAGNSGGLISGSGSLLVVPLPPAINTNAPIMQVSLSGTSLSLAWPTNRGWILQTNGVALNAANQWFDYPGSAVLTNLTIPINPALTNVYFRMVHTNTP